MNGDLLMKALLVAYVVIAAVFGWEHNWPKMFYWLAAAQITASVLVMR